MTTKQILQLPNGEVLGVFDTFADAFIAKGSLPDKDFIASRIYPVPSFLSGEHFQPAKAPQRGVSHETSTLQGR